MAIVFIVNSKNSWKTKMNVSFFKLLELFIEHTSTFKTCGSNSNTPVFSFCFSSINVIVKGISDMFVKVKCVDKGRGL